MMSAAAKPLPQPSPESEPYWVAAREHRLELPRCADCAHVWFPPSRTCPSCLSPNFSWVPVSGRGTVFSFVIYDRPFHPAFTGDVPYAVALIELAEGPRLIASLVDIPIGQIACAMPVAVVFDDVTAEITIPRFRPTTEPAA